MKRLLLPLLASLALPTAVNAETITLTENEYFDRLTYGSFSGSIMTLCHAENKGYLSNNQKLELIDFYTYKLKGMLKDKTNYDRYRSNVFSNIIKVYPNCFD